VADWNLILFALNQSNCEDNVEFEEVKTYEAKKPVSRQAFTSSKYVKFEGYVDEETNESFVSIEVTTAIKSLIKPVVSRSEGVPFTLS
jgi:hypothetical protein